MNRTQLWIEKEPDRSCSCAVGESCSRCRFLPRHIPTTPIAINQSRQELSQQSLRRRCRWCCFPVGAQRLKVQSETSPRLGVVGAFTIGTSTRLGVVGAFIIRLGNAVAGVAMVGPTVAAGAMLGLGLG